MIKYFKEPKKIKLNELLTSGKHYVQRFAYGEEDNIIDVVIKDITPSIRYTRLTDEGAVVCLKTEFVFPRDIKSFNLTNVPAVEGYSTVYGRKFKTVEELFDIEISVVGTWEYTDEK